MPLTDGVVEACLDRGDETVGSRVSEHVDGVGVAPVRREHLVEPGHGGFREACEPPAVLDEGVGGHDAQATRVRDDGDVAALGQTLRVENRRGVEQAGHLVHAHDALSAERRLVDLVAAGHRAGMGQRRLGALGVPSRLEHDDRLVASESARRAHEAPGVTDALHVDEDRARVLVFAQEVDEVGEVDVDHAAHRGEHREADVRVDRPVEHAGAQRAALRDQRDVARLGVDAQERCVEPNRGADHAQTVGSHDAHRAVVAGCRGSALRARRPSPRSPRIRPRRRWRRALLPRRTAPARRGRSLPASRPSRGRSARRCRRSPA